jgi:ABC-2 type transport system ATP-binding protein
MSITQAALRFHQVVKRYAGAAVLDGVDLEIAPGECVGLAGVNGAGKTSLIKCLLDFVALDGGSIDIFGVPHRDSAARRPLVFLPERFQPPYYLTGARFLSTMMKLHGRALDDGLIARECTLLGLPQDALAKPVRQHSKGTSQKLGLAACFLSGKTTLVLDEPMSGLDPQARVLFKDRLRRARAEGATVLFSSHLLADVEELCDRMVILHGGRLRFTGTPAACRAVHGADTLEGAFMKAIA